MAGLPDVTCDQAAVGTSNAVLYRASDESRYVTGTVMVIDAGAAQPFKIPHAGG